MSEIRSTQDYEGLLELRASGEAAIKRQVLAGSWEQLDLNGEPPGIKRCYEDRLLSQVKSFLREHHHSGTLSAAELKVLTMVLAVLFAYLHDLSKLSSSFIIEADDGRRFDGERGTLEQFAATAQKLIFSAQVGRGDEHSEFALAKGLTFCQRHMTAVYQFLAQFFDLKALTLAQSEAQIKEALAPFAGTQGVKAIYNAVPYYVRSHGANFLGQLTLRSDNLAVSLSRGSGVGYTPWYFLELLQCYVLARGRTLPESINERYSDIYLADSKVYLVANTLALDSFKEIYGIYTGQGRGAFDFDLRQLGLGDTCWCRIACGADLIYAQVKMLDLTRYDFAAQQQHDLMHLPLVNVEVMSQPDLPFTQLVTALAKYALHDEVKQAEVAPEQGIAAKEAESLKLSLGKQGLALAKDTVPQLGADEAALGKAQQIEVWGLTRAQVRALLKPRVNATNVELKSRPFTELPQRMVICDARKQGGHLCPFAQCQLQYCFEQLPPSVVQAREGKKREGFNLQTVKKMFKY